MNDYALEGDSAINNEDSSLSQSSFISSSFTSSSFISSSSLSGSLYRSTSGEMDSRKMRTRNHINDSTSSNYYSMNKNYGLTITMEGMFC